MLLGACGRGGQAGGPPRNLLIVTIDTLRADHLSAYGYSRRTSPGIDRLAAEGALFENAHSVASWTLPSIVSMFTSLYPSAHACQGDRSALGESYTTLAEHLAGAGFVTAAVTSHVYLSKRRGLHQGFEHFDEELVQTTRKRSHEAITSPAITEKGLAWLEERAGGHERWFLWLHYFDPHSLYLEHGGSVPDFGSANVDRYDGEIAFTDQHVGKVLERLDELDLADETIVVLLADHGEEFQDHGGVGHRTTLYEEVLRIPLIVRAPGFAPRRVTELVGSVDVLPTICELLDLAPPASMQGRSLVPLLCGESRDTSPLLAEMRNSNRKDWDALIEGRHKLLYDVTRERKLLFDLATDPRETTDVAADHPDLVDSMWTRMQDLITESRERSAEYGGAAPIDLSAEEEETLEQLGYGGDH